MLQVASGVLIGVLCAAAVLLGLRAAWLLLRLRLLRRRVARLKGQVAEVVRARAEGYVWGATRAALHANSPLHPGSEERVREVLGAMGFRAGAVLGRFPVGQEVVRASLPAFDVRWSDAQETVEVETRVEVA